MSDREREGASERERYGVEARGERDSAIRLPGTAIRTVSALTGATVFMTVRANDSLGRGVNQ